MTLRDPPTNFKSLSISPANSCVEGARELRTGPQVRRRREARPGLGAVPPAAIRSAYQGRSRVAHVPVSSLNYYSANVMIASEISKYTSFRLNMGNIQCRKDVLRSLYVSSARDTNVIFCQLKWRKMTIDTSDKFSIH